MRKSITNLFLFILLIQTVSIAQTVDVLIKGYDNGVRHSKQEDYREAEMDAKLKAIERAGVEIRSITEVENFKLKYDLIESKAKAVLLPGFQIIDLGYQEDGTYLVILSGKVQVEQKIEDAKITIVMNSYKDLRPIGDRYSTDVAERGGGIESYTWELFPETYIEESKEFLVTWLSKGLDFFVNYSVDYELTGIDEENLKKAKISLSNGKPIACSFYRAMSVTLSIPPGKYYIDYSYTLNREFLGSRRMAPMNYHHNSDQFADWGSHEFVIASGEYKTIVCTPNGKNVCPILNTNDLRPFLKYIVYGARK